jgi:hypothetical protein
LRASIKSLQDQAEAVEEQLLDIYNETGQKDFGCLVVYEKTGIAKFKGLENKALKQAQEELMNELEAKFVKRSLDMNAIFTSLGSDKALIGHLTLKGLTVEQGKSMAFKEVKK